MTSRRDFMRGGLALSAVAAGAVAFAHSAAATAAATPVLTIVDSTLAASAAFAAAAERRGERVQRFAGDVGNLWLKHIEPRWLAGNAAIAGFTGAGVLFCLETLARDYGHDAVQRIELAPDGAYLRVESAFESGIVVLPPFVHAPRAAADAAFVWVIAPLDRPRLRGGAGVCPYSNRPLQG